MKWIVVPAALAVVVAFSVPAQSQSLNGCWQYSDGSVFSSACFSASDTGTFNLEYAIEDASQGLIKGSCNGRLEVTERRDDGITFVVPFQDEACRQEEQVFRMAQRIYACTRNGPNLVCELAVYYDDGTVFSQATGLEYSR